MIGGTTCLRSCVRKDATLRCYIFGHIADRGSAAFRRCPDHCVERETLRSLDSAVQEPRRTMADSPTNHFSPITQFPSPRSFA